MHIRPATHGDISQMADISVPAFMDDELYTWIAPGRRKYKEAFRDAFVRKHRKRLLTPGYVVHVAVTDDRDDEWNGEEQITGYAFWERLGKSDVAMKWRKESWSTYFERKLRDVEDYYHDFFHLDPSLDYARLETFRHALRDSSGKDPDVWKLWLLCTATTFQRRGVAGMLVDWGIETAIEENRPIGLASSDMASGLYLKKGFRICEMVPIEGWIDARVMLWEPKGREGQLGTLKDVKAMDPLQ